MHFTLICRDAPGALEKRLAARDEHLEKIHELKAAGSIIDGGALLDDEDTMIGSIVMCSFPDRAGLDAYLESEIYIRAGVWEDIQILPMKRVRWSD